MKLERLKNTYLPQVLGFGSNVIFNIRAIIELNGDGEKQKVKQERMRERERDTGREKVMRYLLG